MPRKTKRQKGHEDEHTHLAIRVEHSYEVTIYGDNLGSGDIRATLKDVQERDEYGSPKYRQYRGRQIPIYKPPPGMGRIDKIRGEQRWTAWLRVSPRFTSDALALLSNGRALFLAIHERKTNRTRWVRELANDRPCRRIDPGAGVGAPGGRAAKAPVLKFRNGLPAIG